MRPPEGGAAGTRLPCLTAFPRNDGLRLCGGSIVRHIDDKGFIKFLPLGGFDAKTLTAQRVIVHGKKDLIGVMGVKPIHVMSPAERTKLPEVTDFFIDLGMSKEEVEKYVSVGDSVTRERDLSLIHI